MAAEATETVPAEPVVASNVTPAGIIVEYSPAPRRFYRVNGEECPSVTTVLDCLNKPLSWHGMKIGVAGVIELVRSHDLDIHNTSLEEIVGDKSKEIKGLLTIHKLSVNHQLKKDGDRGTSVHDAFEDFFVNDTWPHPEIYPEAERPYVEGLVKFLTDWELNSKFGVVEAQAEVMVGSLQHLYAGRYDLRCKWGGGPMVTRTYPKRANKVEELSAGRYMLDLKTSSGVYQSHALQLAAYEGASVECGYEPTDYQAVIHVTKTGEYELVRTTATLEDFLAVRRTYEVLRRKMTA
jgi:hypothetical protein